MAQAQADIAAFLRENVLVARTPFATSLLFDAAALAYEGQMAQPCWAGLSVELLFKRLRVEQAFFPAPEKVVAYYEVLHLFVPFLVEHGLVDDDAGDSFLDALAHAKVPLVDAARKVLRTRRAALERHGAWHEVLRTMGGP